MSENFIHGDVSGYVVQARDVHGDVHFPVPAPPPRFAGVPPRVTDLVGREGVLTELRERLDQDTAVVVTGLGGVGKTALVTEFCHRYRADFRLIRWIVASSREAVVDALLALAAAVRVDTARLSAQDAIRSAFEAVEGRWLLVFDNVDQAGWISGLLPVEPTASILVTSRWRDWSDLGLATLPLTTIEQDDAVALLTAITGRPPDEAAGRLATRLGGLCLAVRQAAAYCARTHCDFATYLRLLDERGVDLYERDGTVKAVLETSLDRVGELARAILFVCAFLPPTGIRAELFLGAVASNEPLLRHGDEIEVRDALSELERYSLLERTRQQDGRPASFGVHRLIQQLCRIAAGERREVHAQVATRVMRRASIGWDYYLADTGTAVVGVERGTGRLLLTRTATGTRGELPLPPDAVDLPLSVEVDDSRVTVRYAEDVAEWTVDESARPSSTPTHVLADALSAAEHRERHVRLPDGSVLVVWGAFGLTVEPEDGSWSSILDPGWYSANRAVHSPPVVDPTGRWLLVPMVTWKHYDHGWIAVWRVADVLAGTGEEPLEADRFHPNGRPYVEEGDSFSMEPVTALCFSADGSRLYLLDDRTIHAWTWPERTVLWRIPRPELTVTEATADLGAAVRCCTDLSRGDVVRAALADGRVVDIRVADLAVTEVARHADPVAISAEGVTLDRASGLVEAFGVDDGSFVGRTRDGRLVRVDPAGRVRDWGAATGEVIAVHRSGAALLVEDGDRIRHLAVVGGGLRQVGSEVRCRTGGLGGDQPRRPMTTRAAFASADQVVIGCGCSLLHGDDVIVLRCEPPTAGPRTTRLGGAGGYTYGVDQVVTAVAADGGVAVAGTIDGKVTVWAGDGPEEDEMRERFTATVSDLPIRWLLPHLDTRAIVAIDDAGHVAVLRWG